MVVSDMDKHQLEAGYLGDLHHALVQLREALGIPGVHARPVVEREAVFAFGDAGNSLYFFFADTVFQQVATEGATDIEVAEGTVLPLGHAPDFNLLTHLRPLFSPRTGCLKTGRGYA